jgi:hypothetical protein
MPNRCIVCSAVASPDDQIQYCDVMPVRHVLLQGLSGDWLEEAAQGNLQAPQCKGTDETGKPMRFDAHTTRKIKVNYIRVASHRFCSTEYSLIKSLSHYN